MAAFDEAVRHVEAAPPPESAPTAPAVAKPKAEVEIEMLDLDDVEAACSAATRTVSASQGPVKTEETVRRRMEGGLAPDGGWAQESLGVSLGKASVKKRHAFTTDPTMEAIRRRPAEEEEKPSRKEREKEDKDDEAAAPAPEDPTPEEGG